MAEAKIAFKRASIDRFGVVSIELERQVIVGNSVIVGTNHRVTIDVGEDEAAIISNTEAILAAEGYSGMPSELLTAVTDLRQLSRRYNIMKEVPNRDVAERRGLQ